MVVAVDLMVEATDFSPWATVELVMSWTVSRALWMGAYSLFSTSLRRLPVLVVPTSPDQLAANIDMNR